MVPRSSKRLRLPVRQLCSPKLTYVGSSNVALKRAEAVIHQIVEAMIQNNSHVLSNHFCLNDAAIPRLHEPAQARGMAFHVESVKSNPAERQHGKLRQTASTKEDLSKVKLHKIT